MFNGGHVVTYSTDVVADHLFFKEVLWFGNVDAGGGWLIFSLPPSELAFSPDESLNSHDSFFV